MNTTYKLYSYCCSQFKYDGLLHLRLKEAKFGRHSPHCFSVFIVLSRLYGIVRLYTERGLRARGFETCFALNTMMLESCSSVSFDLHLPCISRALSRRIAGWRHSQYTADSDRRRYSPTHKTARAHYRPSYEKT
jgi:hypothetical protein